MTTAEARGRARLGLGAGWSDATDPAIAAREAVESALDGRMLSSADLVVVFADERFAAVPIVDAATAAAAPARLVACSAPATFASTAGLARCVAMHLPAGKLRAGIGWADAEPGEAEAAARLTVGRARDEAAHHGSHGAVLLLADHQAGDPKRIVRGAYDVSGATIPIVGGVVGCADGSGRSWLVADGMILRRGVVAVWLAAREPVAGAVAHGWRPVGRAMQVTRATDSRIVELDGRPAADAYREACLELEPDVPVVLPGPLPRPLGVPSDDGSYDVRVFAEDSETGIELVGSVHEQAIVRLMTATSDELVGAAADAASGAVTALDRPCQGVFAFSCLARHEVLGEEVVRQIDALGAILGEVPAIGFTTYGEFAKVPGSGGFHAASVAVLAL